MQRWARKCFWRIKLFLIGGEKKETVLLDKSFWRNSIDFSWFSWKNDQNPEGNLENIQNNDLLKTFTFLYVFSHCNEKLGNGTAFNISRVTISYCLPYFVSAESSHERLILYVWSRILFTKPSHLNFPCDQLQKHASLSERISKWVEKNIVAKYVSHKQCIAKVHDVVCARWQFLIINSWDKRGTDS